MCVLQGQSFTPSVIEPSFGIGRIIYCLFEHSFYVRPNEDEQKAVFRLAPLVAPIKCTVFPLVQRQDLEAVAVEVSHALTRAGLASKIDTTGTSIGKRYARTDEIGCPFAITVDGQVSAPRCGSLCGMHGEFSRIKDLSGPSPCSFQEHRAPLPSLADGGRLDSHASRAGQHSPSAHRQGRCGCSGPSTVRRFAHLEPSAGHSPGGAQGRCCG